MEIQATTADYIKLTETNMMARLQVESIALQRVVEEMAEEIAELRTENAELKGENKLVDRTEATDFSSQVDVNAEDVTISGNTNH